MLGLGKRVFVSSTGFKAHFLDGSAIVNFKPVLTHLRVYSSLSHTEPARLFKDNPHPVTRERSIRRPLVPFVKMAIPILLAGARAKYWLDTPASIRSEHEDFFEECFAMSDYVPAGPPMLLLAEVRVYVLERCYIWSKRKSSTNLSDDLFAHK